MEGRLQRFLELVEHLQNDTNLEDVFSEEFAAIKSETATFRLSTLISTDSGGTKENVKKNRYKDILPYDQTRVQLSLLVADGYSDYINANFIKGVNNERCYIATQGPLNKTVTDFWRMIWEYNVKVIIMACREVEMGKRKCECYWSSEGKTSQFGPFSVTNVKEDKGNEEVIVRKLEATFQNETRIVYHYQYIAWPDHGIPDSYDCILDMIDSVREQQGQETSPLCVHCSAGCGRTGVICTMDYVKQLLLTESLSDDFSIFNIILEMRRQRPAIVQTKEQYAFVYNTVAEMFRRQLHQLSHDHDYENVTKNSVSSYEDVKSNTEELRPKVPQAAPRRFNSTEKSTTENSSEPCYSNTSALMNDTYAVVRKPKGHLKLDNVTTHYSGAAALSPVPPDPKLKPSLHLHYDNLPIGQTTPVTPNVDALYSIVKPKSRRPQSPSQSLLPAPTIPLPKAEENIYSGQDSNQGYDKSYSQTSSLFTAVPTYPTVTPPVLRAKDQESDNLDYSHVYVPGQGDYSSPAVKSSTAGSSKGKPVPQKKGQLDIDYEDVSEVTSGGGTLSRFSQLNGLGFNHRIGKPRGPRDPPPEWSCAVR
ncbi:tyrosine-protein phosphatase non-receptor type 18-like [Protopterus annectens]|uniref:tyrosine-protein phosphatase non-receptor type 18-like n=1 Tax=Protopterus annectens TaxID=7888 RepID=UPI001CF93D33|nr:tyrosine-protein phosphatase non-receptor type 18-like [Protopterus annectens]